MLRASLAALALLWVACGEARSESALPEQSSWIFAPDFAERARAVSLGGGLFVEDVPLLEGSVDPRAAPSPPTRDLRLTRFRVFAPDGEVVVHGRGEPRSLVPPAIASFRGRIEGVEDSMAVLTVTEGGAIRGFVSNRAHLWTISSEAPSAPPTVALVDPNGDLGGAPAPWICDQAPLPTVAPGPDEAQSTADLEGVASAGSLAARVAIETDFEFRNLFSSDQQAIAYVADLMAAISAIYSRDIDVALEVGYLSLWSSGPAGDPWTNRGSTAGALDEFRDYWNLHRTHVPRSVAHMLSGKPLGGGIAYIGVLCNTPYGYGLTSSIQGVFSATQPGLFWDLLAVSHEIGHNFGASHSHCYVPPVDQCYNAEPGCWAGALAVPQNGGGSIMSYCHLRPGGYANQSLWLGRAGYYGVSSERIPIQMRLHAESRTSCLNAMPPVVDLSAAPTTIPSGDSALLTWSASHVDSCVASGGWSGTKATSGSQAVTPAATTAYTLTCSGPAGEAAATATVAVVDPPSVSLVASPSTIARGEATTLSWTSSQATSCTALGAWTGARVLSGSKSVTPGGTMTYALECSGPGGTRSDAVTVNVTLPEPGILVADFDSGADGFSSTGRWARSAESAHGAGQAWSDSPGGNYQNSVVTTLWSPAFDLSRYAAVSASFWHRYELQPGRDFGSILVDGGPAITEIASFTGTSNGWIPASFDLSAFAGRKSVRIGFRVTTDTSVVADGWYVDDVVVTGEESGARFVPITPCRLLDTRATNGPYGGQSIPAATSWFFRAAGDCGVPGDARAVTVVVAVVNPAATGHATLFAADQPRPVASAINFPAGTTRASNSIVKLPLDGGGDFALHNGSPGPAHFIVDVSGYFE